MLASITVKHRGTSPLNPTSPTTPCWFYSLFQALDFPSFNAPSCWFTALHTGEPAFCCQWLLLQYQGGTHVVHFFQVHILFKPHWNKWKKSWGVGSEPGIFKPFEIKWTLQFVKREMLEMSPHPARWGLRQEFLRSMQASLTCYSFLLVLASVTPF